MRTVLSIILFLSIQISFAQIVSEKERAILKDELLEDRFQNLLPQLMDDADLDMWLLISREYNEDPVLKNHVACNMVECSTKNHDSFL